jgi:hypothetical protein
MAPEPDEEFPDQFPSLPSRTGARIVTPETGDAGLRMVCIHQVTQFHEQEAAVHLPVLVKKEIEFLHDPLVFLEEDRLFFRWKRRRMQQVPDPAFLSKRGSRMPGAGG